MLFRGGTGCGTPSTQTSLKFTSLISQKDSQDKGALKIWLQYASNGVRFVENEAVLLGEMLVGSSSRGSVLGLLLAGG
jgi:hypothetical protein